MGNDQNMDESIERNPLFHGNPGRHPSAALLTPQNQHLFHAHPPNREPIPMQNGIDGVQEPTARKNRSDVIVAISLLWDSFPDIPCGIR